MKIRSHLIGGATALLMSTSAFAACPTIMVKCMKPDQSPGKAVVTLDTKNRGWDFNKCYYARAWENAHNTVEKAQRVCVAAGEVLPIWVFKPGFINMIKFYFDKANRAYEGLTDTGPIEQAPGSSAAP